MVEVRNLAETTLKLLFIVNGVGTELYYRHNICRSGQNILGGINKRFVALDDMFQSLKHSFKQSESEGENRGSSDSNKTLLDLRN
jgi:adenosyl cobinamide kinase/adenosyl cobinamide phosphate guanylyltransferase